LEIDGILRRGLSADGAVAAVRTVMPREWDLDLNLRESAPLSEVVFSMRDRELVLSGVLPLGLSANEALSLVGDNAGGEALATAGEGDPETWRAVLGGLGTALDVFDSATGEMSAEKLTIDGVLKPGYAPNNVQAWMSEQIGDGWTVGLSAEETPASEGDTRRNLSTDGPETYRSGYWLPDVDFQVSPENCESEIETALVDNKIRFLTGSARIEEEGRSLLNSLAAVAVRCLNSSVITLEIAGHTDALGNDQANQKLSEERAQAVLDALADRGVRADAMRASGLGETQPIASNNTPEGRAENRRIEFVWTAQEN
ncbi:MAG: OmpA family protein, partial [Pseudomonadota bacterium]